MADNEDSPKTHDEEALDDEFEFDLFDVTDSDLSPEENTSESTAADQDSTENGLQDDLHDDLHDDLDDDILGITEEEVEAEFAALELEDIDDILDIGEDDSLDDDGSAATQADDTSSDRDEDFKASLSSDEQSAADAIGGTDFETDPDLSDDLDFESTREEFGVPDQDLNNNSDKSDHEQNPPKEGILALGNNFPAILASLASLSPRVIVAATAVVLLPVVIFTVLGFNSSDSDAEAEIPETAFSDTPDESQVASDANTVLENSVAEPQDQTLPERPEPLTVDQARLPADESGTEGSDIASAENSGELLTNSAIEQAEQAEFEDPGLLLAQAQTEPELIESEPETEATAETEAELAPETDQQTEVAVVDDEPEVTGEDAEVETDTLAEEEQQAEEAPAPELANEEGSEVEEAPAAAVASESASMPASTGRDYHIIVASLPTQAAAESHAERISDAEISAYVIAPFGSTSNYRVAVASYASLAEARQNIPGLRAVYGEDIWPLRYPPATETPLISTQTGETFIIVASFPNEQLARTHANTLIAAGEQPAIIAPYPPSNRYRVAVARFDNTESAQTALPAYREEHGEESWLLRY